MSPASCVSGLEDFVSGNVECARSPTHLELHVPTSGQRSGASCCAGWGTVTLYQRGHNSPISNVQKRGAWSQAKCMHRYEHSSRIAADYGKLAPEVRTSCEECKKHLRQIMLGLRHLVHRTRQELMLLREAGSA